MPASAGTLRWPRTSKRAEADEDALVDRAIAHGDEHVIKFTEACLHRHALGPSPVYFAAADHVLGMIPRR